MSVPTFDPLQRVLVERTSGDVESWVVLHYLDGRVIVGADIPEGEATKAVPPAVLQLWQECLPLPGGGEVILRAATESQLEVATRFAESYAREEGEAG